MPADIQAAIFDMDGLLIDSEPLWQEAEIACFRPLGVPIDRDLCRQSAGKRLDEVINDWHQRFGWQGPSPDDMHDAVLAEVTRLIMQRGQALPGVHDTMTCLAKAGLRMAIASSSPPALIDAVVGKLSLEEFMDLTHSGALEARGKPDPAAFLTTARKLGVNPGHCVVFEDAPAGIEAAQRAGMQVIAVPSVFTPDDPGIRRANRVLTTLEDFHPEMLNTLITAE
ncbi:HAD-IA family hydrolase [Wenzhouxiangella sp. AB-CW3]|uniref:HAD family hydrolase n=1 Tax=Wenzhouxiangella sp. AB-CW3 TaxID=2771012 RepID=UPI00168A811E|nr:HAD-IA family hydrolase [Wenzhouxiangella sp. AB-CW3]QOC23825.1 HAD-IA family hydrolase [Wenzhouxiangella sp. AB-CW3]